MICTGQAAQELRVAVALGGGGARGIAHFGAIQGLYEYGIGIERIVGTSIGSLVGAMVGTHDSVEEAGAQALEFLQSPEFESKQEALFGVQPRPGMNTTSGLLAWYDRIRSYLWAQQLITRVFRQRSLIPGQVLDEVIACLVPEIDISESRIPLSIVAVDLLSGHPVVLERGPLRKAIAASSAIPAIFPPVEWEGMLLCDLGVIDSLPTRFARSYSDCVVAVDVGPRRARVEQCESALHVLLRMDEIAERLYRRQTSRLGDVLIRPHVGNREWFDFSHPDDLVEAGLQASRQAIRRRLTRAESEPISPDLRLYQAGESA